MNDGGMSIGRPGGPTPGGKVEKALSELGPAKEADITQLQSGLKSNQTEPSSLADTSKKPLDFQDTRITNVTNMTIATGNSIGKAMVEYGQKLHAVTLTQDKDLKKKLEEVHNKTVTQVDAIELQVMSSEMLIFTDAISKGVGKVVTGLQTIIKQQ